MRSKETEYRLDTERITVGGYSAGAMTALFLAYADRYGEGDSGNPGFSSDIHGVFANSGRLDS